MKSLQCLLDLGARTRILPSGAHNVRDRRHYHSLKQIVALGKASICSFASYRSRETLNLGKPSNFSLSAYSYRDRST
jgi:hypothetical protein